MAFAIDRDVKTAYEGDLAAGSEARVQYLLDTVSARLRVFLPDLEDRIASDDDLKLLAKDVVVQAVLRRLPGSNQQVRAETQAMGPYSTTVSYTTDTSGTFSDEDLAILGGRTTQQASGRVGTIRLRRPDWHVA